MYKSAKKGYCQRPSVSGLALHQPFTIGEGGGGGPSPKSLALLYLYTFFILLWSLAPFFLTPRYYGLSTRTKRRPERVRYVTTVKLTRIDE